LILLGPSFRSHDGSIGIFKPKPSAQLLSNEFVSSVDQRRCGGDQFEDNICLRRPYRILTEHSFTGSHGRFSAATCSDHSALPTPGVIPWAFHAIMAKESCMAWLPRMIAATSTSQRKGRFENRAERPGRVP